MVVSQGNQNNTPGQQQNPSKPVDASIKQETTVIRNASRSDLQHSSALRSLDPKVTSHKLASPPQPVDKLSHKNATGHHSGVNFNKERSCKTQEEKRSSYQQPHMNTLSHVDLNYLNELPKSQKRSQSVSNIVVDETAENKKQPRQTSTETKYKNLEILW